MADTHEAISTTLASLSVGDDNGFGDIAEWFEVAAQCLVGGVVR